MPSPSPRPIRVLTIGPSVELVGGMSSVIGQMLKLDLDERFQIQHFPITRSTRLRENRTSRAVRHVRQRIALGKLLRSLRPSIVHIHTCSGFSFHRSIWDARVARRHGCAVIMHVHGAAFDEFFSRANSVEQRLIRSGLQRASRVIALSESWRSKLRAMAPAAKVVVIENAIEQSRRELASSQPGSCRFTTLSRMDAWKGIDDLLDACALLRRWGIAFQLTLAGPEGTAGDADTLRKKIEVRQLTQCVAYVGTRVGEEKKTLLANTDVYVQPSHHEGMPISVLEAMANSVPVIATCVGAVPEIIRHDVEGLLVNARDPASLASAMAALALDIPRRLALGTAGCALTNSRFSLMRFRQELIALYEGLHKELNPNLTSAHGDFKPSLPMTSFKSSQVLPLSPGVRSKYAG